MFNFMRKVRLRDLEVYEISHDQELICMLFIEDMRRPMTEEKQHPSYNFYDELDFSEIQNVIYTYSFIREKLSVEEGEIILEFTEDILKDIHQSAIIPLRIIDKKRFDNLPVELAPKDYQEILNLFNSPFKVPPLNNFANLTQD